MKEKEQKSLKKIDFPDLNLPMGFNTLSDDEKKDIINKIQKQDLSIREEMMQKGLKSKIAENDLQMAIETISQLDSEKKIYTKHLKGETGSGNYELKIRGGDTKFIVPIIIALGFILIGIVSVLLLTRS